MTVYFDHNATTPLAAEVVDAMLPYLHGEYGNPSSIHTPGHRVRVAMDHAREQVAELVGAHPSQVIFTSGATEANNAAIKGYAFAHAPGRMLIGATEHASVRTPAFAMRRRGWQVDELAVDAQGLPDTTALERLSEAPPALLSLMWANNETGVVADLPAIAATARERGIVVHTDAVQAVGKLPVDFAASGAHMLSLSAHKMYGPKGIGALIVDKAVELEPLIHGGGQEKGRRGGTEYAAGIVGFGAAAARLAREHEHWVRHTAALHERLEQALAQELEGAVVFGAGVRRLDNTTFMALPGIDGETLIMALDREGFAVSAGAACGAEQHQPSRVLEAMGVAPELARCAVRISLGTDNSEEDVDALVRALKTQQVQLRTMAALSWD